MLVEQEGHLQRSVQTLSERKNQLETLLHRHTCLKKSHLPMTNTTSNTLNISKTDVKTIPTTTLLDSNNSKRVTINLTNDASSSSVPMITIHILPEVAQAILGSTSVDRNKLADLLQQANTTNSFITTNNNNNNNNSHITLDSISSSTSMNRTS